MLEYIASGLRVETAALHPLKRLHEGVARNQQHLELAALRGGSGGNSLITALETAPCAMRKSTPERSTPGARSIIVAAVKSDTPG